MAKNDTDGLEALRRTKPPAPNADARRRALDAALRAYDEAENFSATPQGSRRSERLTDRTFRFWREMMQKKLVATPAIAGLVALPVAGVVTWQLMDEFRPGAASPDAVVETGAPSRQRLEVPAQPEAEVFDRDAAVSLRSPEPQVAAESAPPALGGNRHMTRNVAPGAASKLMAPPTMAPVPAIAPDPYVGQDENRDRFQSFDTNPVRSALENPVSTFSIDVDTASYAFARRSLKEGFLPPADSVRVEEMINYFPYDWAGPQGADVPFNTTVTVTPTPWNEHTQLMHVAIKGFDTCSTS